jgi:hypothetical protein
MNEAKRNALRALQESMDRRDNGGPAGLPESNGHGPHDTEAHHYEPAESAEPPVDVWAQARQREFASAS